MHYSPGEPGRRSESCRIIDSRRLSCFARLSRRASIRLSSPSSEVRLGDEPLACRARHESRGDRCGDDGEEGDSLEHDDGGDKLAAGILRGDIPVADRGHGLQREPHPDPDARVLLVVEQPKQDAPTYHDDGCRRDYHARGRSQSGRLAEELRHPALDRARPGDGLGLLPGFGKTAWLGHRGATGSSTPASRACRRSRRWASAGESAAARTRIVAPAMIQKKIAMTIPSAP